MRNKESDESLQRWHDFIFSNIKKTKQMTEQSRAINGAVEEEVELPHRSISITIISEAFREVLCYFS